MATLLMAVLVLASCMKSDEVETYPECAILSFAVNSITSPYPTKKYDSSGNATDTIVSRTLTGSDIHFNIDQLNGHIYTVDSLPNWVNLNRVVPTFTCSGNVFGKVVDGDELYYKLTSGSDSIDFSKTVELLCVATDGLSSRSYKVDIYKHVANTDTLEWTPKTSDFALVGPCKMLSTDTQVFAFAKNSAGEESVSVANIGDATTWSAPTAIPVDGSSVVLWHGAFYGRGDDGFIYRATADQQPTSWTKASDLRVERLLAADAYYLYAYDGTAIIGSDDLSTWSQQGTEDLQMLPETSIHAFAYTSKVNSTIQTVVMTGLSSHNSSNGVAWMKLTSADASINQPWSYIQVTSDNPYGLPHLGQLSVTHYHDALFAIGTASEQYKYLYRSDDHGITWHPQTEKYPVPAGLTPDNGAASIATVGTELWIIQENGTIWQGSIQ